jgi:hypothetical protein
VYRNRWASQPFTSLAETANASLAGDIMLNTAKKAARKSVGSKGHGSRVTFRDSKNADE